MGGVFICLISLKIDKMSIIQNYLKIRSEIPDHVKIVAASKTRSAKEISKLIDAGCTDIGENYVQEAEEKYHELGKDAKKLRWHLIGHLQKNKAKRALEIFDVIQSVDSLEIAKEINRRAQKQVVVYVEVNIGDEKTKSGVKPGEVKNLIEEIAQLENLRVTGLMTIEPYSKNPEDSRIYFRKMKILFDEIQNLKTLSMGMSGSYKAAIEEGSNMVRIGSKIFGQREY